LRKGALCLLASILIAACTPDAAEPPSEARTQEPGEAAQGNCSALRPLINRVRRGWYPRRSPQLGFVVREPNFVGPASSPPHDGPWDFLVDVPLVLYGPGVFRSNGTVDAPASIVDLAPTTAALIGYDDWPERSGRTLVEAIVPGSPAPRLVVTVVWDGVGDNTLRAHPRAWPFLSRLMRNGTSYSDMTVGSTPSNTAPIHTSLATGAFPEDHGIISVRQLDGSGAWVDSWEDEDPSALELATVADLYDRSRDNVPLIGAVGTASWHLGMIGHGAALGGADLDLAALLTALGTASGNSAFYEVPDIVGASDLQRHAETLDLADGRADGKWGRNSLDDLALLESSPAFVIWQQEVVEDLIVERDFGDDGITDLLYINVKQADVAGHEWGLNSPEVRQNLKVMDDTLKDLVQTLDTAVGRERWALMLTADHGQMPYPEESGGFAISGSDLDAKLEAKFDRAKDGIDLVERVPASGLVVNTGQLRANDVTLRELAEWIAGYTMEDALDGAAPPRYVEGRADDPLFDAVVIKGKTAIKNC
jgi:hypothetical protein